jgi:putative PIN family toxin of toxin-antitoxin system
VTDRAVFDCMVLLQAAARATGPAAACLRLAEQEHVELCLSRPILDELRDVLGRPRLRQRFRSLTDERVAAFLDRLARVGHVWEDVPAAVTLDRDPQDEKYQNLAAAVGAKYLVSRDNDLLDLRSDEGPTGQALSRACPGLRILDPVEFLQALRPPELESPPTDQSESPSA